MKFSTFLAMSFAFGASLSAPAHASGERDRSERSTERSERERFDQVERSERDSPRGEERPERQSRRDDGRKPEASERGEDRNFDSEKNDDRSSINREREDDDDDQNPEFRLSSRDESDAGKPAAGDNSRRGSDSGNDQDDDESGSGSSSDFDDDDDAADYDKSGSDDDDERDEDDEDDDDSDKDHEANEDNKDSEQTRLTFDDKGQPYRDRELVVLLKSSTELSQIADLGLQVIETRALRRDDGLVVRIGFPADMGAQEALSRLRSGIPGSPSAFNHVYSMSGETSAGSPPLGIVEQSSGSAAGLVAVIDGFSGGTVMDHEVESFVRNRAEIVHGDHVVSVLVNDLVALGYALPDRLLAADVVEQTGGAAPSASIVGLIDALDWASAEGAKIVNISLTGPPNVVLETVINEIASDGTLLIAAVGNSGPATEPGFPAAYDSVMGITAVDTFGIPYIYAARGSQVELSAQAVAIATGESGDKLTGTSFAAPRVSALAATLIEQSAARDVRTQLHKLAADLGAPGRDDVFGYGLLPPPASPTKQAMINGLQKKISAPGIKLTFGTLLD